MAYVDKLSELTIREKSALCCTPDCITYAGVPRLDIPAIRGNDGPQGVRMEDGRTSTALPCNMALAATFDEETAFEYGKVLGEECIANDFQIIYGPGVNLMRTPMNGRNFEYMGEEPVVAGKIGAAYVKGCQSVGVAACLKHLALNNQEICRTNGSSNCDWEVIRELYLEAFRIIVKEASPWSIMSSYNKINGEFASQCGTLQQNILKDEWGFDGVVISDAGAVHDGKAAFLNGLDASMAELSFPVTIPEMVEKGELPESMLDEKARRMLLLHDRVARKNSAENPPSLHADFARKCAAESTVMLKNRDHILPLDGKTGKKILITGPAATAFHCIGSLERQGGSGAVHPPYEVTPLAGLQSALEGFELTYMPCFRSEQDQLMDTEMLDKLTIRYFDLKSGELFFEEDKLSSAFIFGPVNAGGITTAQHPASERTFRAEITGRLKAPRQMRGKFSIFDSRLNAKLRYWEEEVLTGDKDKLPFISLDAGETLDFSVNFDFQFVHYAELNLLWFEDNSAQIATLLESAPQFDAVIYFGGRTHLQDKEAIGMGNLPTADITSWELPGEQDEFLSKLVSANRNVIGVFNAGSPFDLRAWHEKMAAILVVWYPGMEGGNAIADVISGKCEPGGRLPFTWGADIMDYACHANGSYPGVREGDDPHTDYLEGGLIGYRYFDYMDKAPLYPFGGGMGYTEFALSGAKISREGGIKLTLSVENCGSRSGREVIHLYAGKTEKTPGEPVKKLVAFRKVSVAPGKSETVEFSLSEQEVENLKQSSFTRLMLGRNAADLPQIFDL